MLILSCHLRPGLLMASFSQPSSPNPCLGCAKVSVRFRRFCECFVTVSFVSAPDFSTCSVVCIVTRLRDRPCRESKRPNRPWNPPSLLFSGFQVLFSPGVKLLWSRALHRPSWCVRTTLPSAFKIRYCYFQLQGLHRVEWGGHVNARTRMQALRKITKTQGSLLWSLHTSCPCSMHHLNTVRHAYAV
jgi:hypothetical protein